MKTTVAKLKNLIVEAVEGMVDVTQNPEAAHAAWPDVTWHDRNIIDDIYPAATEALEKQMTQKRWDFQEVYLGYVPGDDKFVMGWDVWITRGDDSEFTSAFIPFVVSDNGGTIVVHSDGKLELAALVGFYGRDEESGYNLVHQMFPSIVDLRLD